MKRYETVDDYVSASEQWGAELSRLREILLSTDLVEEVKWGAPCYTYDGKNVVGMAGFKSYFGLWFHQGALLADKEKVLINAQEGATKALRQWRMQAERDIKPAIIRRYATEAIQLVKDGKQIGPAKKKGPATSPELEKAFAKNKTARKRFDQLTPGRQREYADYIASAKREKTKQRRIEKILPMINAGVGLNDKYRC